MARLDFQPFDADNHYYEAEDAFTRHVDRKMQKRAVQWGIVDGRKRILVAGHLDRFIPNPTFDPITRPGVLEDYYRGINPEGKSQAELFRGNLEPIRPAYRDRDARVKLLDEQGIESVLLFPTLACGVEEALRRDVEATHAALRGFNRWLLEDWGFAYQGRLFAVPLLSLADPAEAVKELDWALGQGARLVYLRPAPVPKGLESASLGHRDHDPFWARVNEAGITVAFHAGDTGYGRYSAAWGTGGEKSLGFEAFRAHVFGVATGLGRYILDTMAALICHGVFQRFPNVRVCSIENGSFWVPWLFKNLKKAYGQEPKAFAENPLDTFRRHIWVAPFFEDDVNELVRLIGVDHVLFGSDFPHAEGLRDPLSFVHELKDLPDEDVRKVMQENQRKLVTLRPASAA